MFSIPGSNKTLRAGCYAVANNISRLPWRPRTQNNSIVLRILRLRCSILSFSSLVWLLWYPWRRPKTKRPISQFTSRPSPSGQNDGPLPVRNTSDTRVPPGGGVGESDVEEVQKSTKHIGLEVRVEDVEEVRVGESGFRKGSPQK